MKLKLPRTFQMAYHFFSYFKGHRLSYFIGFLFSSCEIILLFVLPIMSEQLVALAMDEVEDVQIVFYLFWLLVLLIPVVGFGKYLVNVSTAKATATLQVALFEHIQALPQQTIGDKKVGDYIARLTTDASKTMFLFKFHTLIRFIQSVVVFPVALTVLLTVDWRLALIALIPSGISLTLSLQLNPYVQKLENEAREEVDGATSLLIELLRAMPIVRIFSLQAMQTKKYERRIDRIKERRERFRNTAGIAYGSIDFFVYAAQAISFIVGLFWVTSGELLLSQVVFSVTLVALMTTSVNQFSAFLLAAQPSLVSIKRLIEVFELPVEKVRKTKTLLDFSHPIAISVEDLSFSYGDEKKVLNNLNFTIQNGERIAIVGASGSGKSTLAKLLIGQLEPTEGKILFFGQDSVEVSHQDIRHLSAYVSQTHFLFNASIRDNFLLAKVDATHEEMIIASQKANIDTFISTLTEGYDTILGEGASNLSGGQKQRLCIARALIKEAPILIFDEMNASLDTKTKKIIMKELEQLPEEKTMIHITHDKEEVKNKDRVIVLN